MMCDTIPQSNVVSLLWFGLLFGFGGVAGAWLPQQPLWRKLSILRTVSKHLKNELRTEVAATYPMSVLSCPLLLALLCICMTEGWSVLCVCRTHVAPALMSYVKNMSGGKVCICPPLAQPNIKG